MTRRIFFGCASLLLMTTVLLSALCLREAHDLAERHFVQSYNFVGKTIAGSFHQSEQMSDRLLGNAVAVLANAVERSDGNISQNRIERMSEELGVDTLNVFSKEGEAILLADLDDYKSPINVFQLCSTYSNLLQGGPTQITGFLPNFSGKPAKYAMAGCSSGRYIVNAGLYDVPAKSFLREATSHDPDVLALRLYAPNGQLFFSIGDSGSANAHHESSDNPGHAGGGDMYNFYFKIPSSVKDCCECRHKGLIDGDDNYHYNLEMTVSAEPLLRMYRKQNYVAATTLMSVVILGLLVTSWMSRRLTAGVRKVAKAADKIGEESSWDTSIEERGGDDELARLIRALNRMLSSLKKSRDQTVELERMRCVEKVAMQVAHDIRSPLAALKLAASNIEGLPSDRLRLIGLASDRINQIAENLLGAKLRSDSPEKRTSVAIKCDLAPLIEQMIAEKEMTCSYVDFGFDNRVGDRSTACVVVEPTHFSCLLSNLLNNSIEACAGHGAVRLTLWVNNDSVSLTVADTGKGIPRHLLERVKQRGFTTGKAGGLGLGLAQAVESVEGWGGYLSIRSTEGAGTTVEVSLPIAPGAAA